MSPHTSDPRWGWMNSPGEAATRGQGSFPGDEGAGGSQGGLLGGVEQETLEEVGARSGSTPNGTMGTQSCSCHHSCPHN